MISISDIWEARRKITENVWRTRLVFSRSLSEKMGTMVYLKPENLQKTGSFKVRGAMNKILSIPEKERHRGVVAFSSGNHAQGVAFSAKLAGVSATIVMPEWAAKNKMAATRSYGARVVQYGKNSVEMESKARAIMESDNRLFVHPFDDEDIIAGQGTIGLEILEDLPDVDTIFIPIGGGGLISGISLAVKSIYPKIRIVGVQPSNSCSMLVSRKAGKINEIESCDTIADGLTAKRPGENTFSLCEKYVDDIITVNDDEIVETMCLLLERTKQLAEPSGVVGLAGIMSGRIGLGKKNVAVISGGNCNFSVLAECIMKREK
ncbi:threonine ammonia-lyase [Biomaibacter acetigenes]|uniref:threonine ammonia-lyase n=1 Tax=Biomaibacter acetigenes TaxID=2316383 RepID=UPI0013CF217F|nr:threonine/serine dehydratase [Biomaibacter acetigenes]